MLSQLLVILKLKQIYVSLSENITELKKKLSPTLMAPRYQITAIFLTQLFKLTFIDFDSLE